MYSKKVRNALKRKGIKVGDTVEVKKDERAYIGVLMPRIDMGDRGALVIKLDNGYNVGLKYSKGMDLRLVSKRSEEAKKIKAAIGHDETKPKISILSIGGTISSKVDYKTGGVIPRFTAEDLIEDVPELADIANIHGRQVDSLLSGNMNFGHYKKLIKEIEKEIKKGCEGIIVTHGTDTMHYTACALSFALQDLPVPVILVGSQRSSDRASSDGPFNLICAARFIAGSDFGEVAVCMHATESDDFCFIYPACKVRKMHTSRRDAFKAVNSMPWALVSPDGRIRFFREDYMKKDRKRKLKAKARFEEKVALLKSYPNIDPKIIDFLAKSGYKGLVLEGTGLGHVPENLHNSLKNFLKKGLAVITSQCLSGRVNMNVYSYGRELEELGIVCGNDMLPEAAYIKLAWLLGNFKGKDEIRTKITENLRGEINDRSEL
ncbi:MAG: Glu-tRNA(Gln) amidotransferase subunit GatD [archaeon]|nr:MAG: Glu-tRNA(Gln) amidotransferase subunit GatD [archaeon]